MATSSPDDDRPVTADEVARWLAQSEAALTELKWLRDHYLQLDKHDRPAWARENQIISLTDLSSKMRVTKANIVRYRQWLASLEKP